MQKKFLKKFYVGVLKVNDENSRIRIRTHLSEAWIHTKMSRFRNTTCTLYIVKCTVPGWSQPKKTFVLPE